MLHKCEDFCRFCWVSLRQLVDIWRALWNCGFISQATTQLMKKAVDRLTNDENLAAAVVPQCYSVHKLSVTTLYVRMKLHWRTRMNQLQAPLQSQKDFMQSVCDLLHWSELGIIVMLTLSNWKVNTYHPEDSCNHPFHLVQFILNGAGPQCDTGL